MLDFSAEQFRPPLGQLAPVVLGALAVAAVLWLYGRRQRDVSRRRRIVLAALRLGALAIVLWMLAGPSAKWGSTVAHRRLPLLVAADLSESMNQIDVTNPAPRAGEDPAESVSRWDALRRTWLTPEYYEQLQRAADVQLFTFGEEERRIGPAEVQALEPYGRETRLYDAVAHAVDAQPRRDASEQPGQLAGIVLLLSDGHDTKRTTDALLASRLKDAGWRVLAVPVGSPLAARNVWVDAAAEADFLFEGQATWIGAQVHHSGFARRLVNVQLLYEGRLLDERTLTLDEATEAPMLRFRVQPPESQLHGSRIEGYRVTVNLQPLPGAPGSPGSPGSPDFAGPPGSTESADSSTSAGVSGGVSGGESGGPQPSEETLLDDNSKWVFLQISPDRIRVAMFESQPYWDTKFLARVLRQDPQIELTSVYRLGEDRTVTVQSNVRSGPLLAEGEADFDASGLSPQWLNDYDVVILGKGVERFFGGERAQWLVDYVQQRGGALVLARGQPFDTSDPDGRRAAEILAPIQPVQWGQDVMHDLELQVAPESRGDLLLQFERLGETDAILTKLPDMLAATRVQNERALTRVLLRQMPARQDDGAPGISGTPDTPGMAAIAHLSAGSGRVLAVLTDGLWRWAFLPSTLKEYDSVYHGLWARTIRWLATGGQFLPGQSMSLSLSALTAEPGQDVRIIVTTREVEPADFQPRLELIAPDGQVQPINLSRRSEQSTQYEATVRREAPGVYQVVLTAPPPPDLPPPPDSPPDLPDAQPVRITGRLAVYDRSEELRDPSARPDALATLATATGGRCLGLDQRQAVPQLLEDLRQARQSDEKWRYVFDRPEIFALLAALLGLEWVVRRRSGLL